MSDNFKINNLLAKIKSSLVQDSYSSGSFWALGKRKKAKPAEENKKQQDQEPLYNSEGLDKFFKLGESMGLSKEEVREALELIVRATAKFNKNLDVSTLVLSNDVIKFPYEENFKDKIPEELFDEMENKCPELHLAVSDPFKFMCKYPKTVSYDMYRKFTYNEILEFSRLNPEEYKQLTE